MNKWWIKLIALSASLLFFPGCNGPLGPLPGGKLSGILAEQPVHDWSFAADVEVVQLETQPQDPHSVNTWIGVYNRKLYIATSLIRGDAEPSQRDWVKHVTLDPNVLIRINDTLYPAIASRVTDQALVDTVKNLLLQKYAEVPTEHSNAAWLYVMESRSL
ncbi:MAG: hypothetical protein ACFHXK_06875 [bacterium]